MSHALRVLQSQGIVVKPPVSAVDTTAPLNAPTAGTPTSLLSFEGADALVPAGDGESGGPWGKNVDEGARRSLSSAQKGIGRLSMTKGAPMGLGDVPTIAMSSAVAHTGSQLELQQLQRQIRDVNDSLNDRFNVFEGKLLAVLNSALLERKKEH